MDHDADRPRGVLSPADRAFLRGETEMTHDQSRRNAEARIRERIVNAIEDFTLLVHTLKPKDREGVFDTVDDPAFVDGVLSMLSFTYLGLKESGMDFEQVLVPAVRRAEEVHAAGTLGSTADVAVDFDVRAEYGTSVDDTADRIRSDTPVTPEELFAVAMADDPVVSEAETILVRLPHGTDADDGVLDRLASYLDAELTHRPPNRVELSL
ncbi:hypothetical protein [Halococcus qingdaonensis]|uniref:hypothetical protein n=1 Tax=Halococcus qingdaonensis TaxID=224402 RepID=UPI002116C4D3|nr:hypothetical protein [Halococcus qingdaonensis]